MPRTKKTQNDREAILDRLLESIDATHSLYLLFEEIRLRDRKLYAFLSQDGGLIDLFYQAHERADALQIEIEEHPTALARRIEQTGRQEPTELENPNFDDSVFVN